MALIFVKWRRKGRRKKGRRKKGQKNGYLLKKRRYFAIFFSSNVSSLNREKFILVHLSILGLADHLELKFQLDGDAEENFNVTILSKDGEKMMPLS